MEQMIPFYIEEGPEGTGAITVVRSTLSVPSIAELVVISGGPVFLFKEKRTVSDCYDATHGKQEPLFNLAGSEGVKAEALVEPDVAQITLHSDNESIGYIRLKECSKHDTY